MLKFLTHKLRTHSLNEDNVTEKVEERDSGTESDDEVETLDTGANTDVVMKWKDSTDISMNADSCACAPSPTRLISNHEQDQQYDHHSSEEELEVINAESLTPEVVESRRRGASSPPPPPEKRKWTPHYSPTELSLRPGSSDDDDKVETPVRFRTSPPLEALKPRRSIDACVCARPSPRRRRSNNATPLARRHRPALDFDKMQQLRMGGLGVRSWRGVGGAGGELSVFCW